MMNIDREALAWAAGFFDGEGWVGTYPVGRARRDGTRYLAPRMMLGQSGHTLPDTLERFHVTIGGIGNLFGPYNRKKATVLPVWGWSVGGYERVQAVTAMLWTWLGHNKRRDARTAIQTASVRNPYERIRVGGSSRFLGVYWHSRAQKWAASASVKGRNVHLGLFQTEVEACEARRAFDLHRGA